MPEHASGRDATETHIGRAHVTPQRGDSLWYKAKVVAPIASLLVLVIGATWAFTAYDKRITVLEVSDAQQDAQIDANTLDIRSVLQWIPTADLKLDLLLEHFGLSIPPKQ